MKIGVFGGGFKPFTSGHFSVLSISLSENDRTILYYALAERKKGSDFTYTRDMAKRVFDIVVPALEREYGERLAVVPGSPTPIVRIFKLIDAIRTGQENELVSFSELGISPRDVDQITVYSDADEIRRFTQYIGTDKEAKY